MNIFEIAHKLRPGNLAHVILEDGEHQYQPILSVDCVPDRKKAVIIKTNDERKIMKAFPAEINKIVLENNGFLIDNTSKALEYYIKMNRNTIMRIRKTKEEGKWSISIVQTNHKPQNDIEVQEVFIGQFTLFFVVENFFESFTNRSLQWVKPKLTSQSVNLQ